MSTQQKELVKANPDIGYRITSGRLTFLSRKIYNSFIYRSQRLGKEGKGVLPLPVDWDIKEHGIAAADYYWMPLADIIDDVAAEVSDKGRIRSHLRELMSVIVERTGAGWQIEHIIQSGRIINTAGPDLKQKGGKLLIGWSFPTALEDNLLNPNEYTRLSLYYQGLLKTEPALVLYEICKRYATSPGQLTARMPWQEWKARMTGSPDGLYKDFSRRSLQTAINEVNASTDINVTKVEHKIAGTKTVNELQFIVQQKAQQGLELEHRPVIDTTLLNSLEQEFGISPIVADKMLSEHGEEKTRAAIEYTRARIANKTLPAVTYPGALLKRNLADGHAEGEKVRTKQIAEKKRAGHAADLAVRERTVSTVVETKGNANFPEGDALAEAWEQYRHSESATVFKRKAHSYDEAPRLQKEGFKSWLASM